MEGLSTRRLWGPVALLLAALLGGCAGTQHTGRYLLHPIPPEEAAGPYSLKAGALVYEEAFFSVALRPLDGRFVAECLAADNRPNPFEADPGRPAPVVLELTLRNTGRDSLHFNPDNVRGYDEEKRTYFPLAFTDQYLRLRERPDVEPLLAVFRELVMPEVQLRPGETRTGYLPLTAHAEVPERLVVTLPLRYAGKEGRTLIFPLEGYPAEPAAEAAK